MNSHTKLIYENNNQTHSFHPFLLAKLKNLYTNMNSHTKLIYENNNQIPPCKTQKLIYENELTYENI